MNRKITPFRKIASLVAISVALLALVAPAFATETLYISNSELNLYDFGHSWSGSATAVNKSWGVTFSGNDEYLSRVRFYIKNMTNSVTGELICYLLNDTFAGEPIAESNNTFNMADLDGIEWVTFTFDVDFLLNSAETYLVTITNHSPLSNEFHHGRSFTGGSRYGDIGSTFYTHAYGMIYQIYTDDTLGGGTPYTPPGGADLTSWDTTITSFTSFIVPLLVIMLPAFLLCFIARRVDKWLIIMGVTIGAGLGYYFNLVPLWVVFLVTIGLIGMAYQSVRGGGGN